MSAELFVTESLSTQCLSASDDALARGGALLRAGQLVAFPTETVYGLGANALDDEAVKGIYAAKGRPSNNPLIVHFPNAEAAKEVVLFSALAEKLAKAFWPGPFTMVLPRKEPCAICPTVSAGLASIAVRVPEHPVAHRLLELAAVPVAAPSANPSGRISPTTADHVLNGLDGKVALILDGGACKVGLESTVVRVTEDRVHVLRPGSITPVMVANAVGQSVTMDDGVKVEPSAPEAPGMLTSHYAPSCPVRLNALTLNPGEALLAFGPHKPVGTTALVENLSENGDLEEAARNLFAALRRMDDAGVEQIAVMPIPDEGIGVAINDRLRRAAAPR